MTYNDGGIVHSNIYTTVVVVVALTFTVVALTNSNIICNVRHIYNIYTYIVAVTNTYTTVVVVLTNNNIT